MVHISFIALHSLSLLPSSGRDIFLFIYLYIFSTLQHNYTLFLHKLHNLPQIVCLTLVFLSLLVFILTHFLHIFKPFLGILFYCSFSCPFASQVWAFVRFTHSAHPFLRNLSLLHHCKYLSWLCLDWFLCLSCGNF